MDHLQEFAPAALTELLRGMPYSPGKLQFAWKAAVGAAVDRATSVTLDEKGRLLVVVSGPLWRKELVRSLPIIRQRLTVLLGDKVIKRIQIQD
jgi:hypothetical protein